MGCRSRQGQGIPRSEGCCLRQKRYLAAGRVFLPAAELFQSNSARPIAGREGSPAEGAVKATKTAAAARKKLRTAFVMARVWQNYPCPSCPILATRSTIHRPPRRDGVLKDVCQPNVDELARAIIPGLSPRSPRVSAYRNLFPDGGASKESPVPKPFRRSAPNVESDAASAPACWTSDIRTDANPRPA